MPWSQCHPSRSTDVITQSNDPIGDLARLFRSCLSFLSVVRFVTVLRRGSISVGSPPVALILHGPPFVETFPADSDEGTWALWRSRNNATASSVIENKSSVESTNAGVKHKQNEIVRYRNLQQVEELARRGIRERLRTCASRSL